MIKVQVINNSNNPLPKYETEGSAGMDLLAYLVAPEGGHIKYLGKKFHGVVKETGNVEIHLYPGGRILIPTGLKVAVPLGYELQIRPRSGLAIKHGITVNNSPGTVDSDYRGDIGIILLNTSSETFIISNGDRIAQAVLKQVEQAEFEEVTELPSTDRGEGGFGSTGK